ncbi:PTS sugar transporter subunit IIA [Ammoniphilus sp. 3BR4]|uniref:PTS sugar transporter subunit IIA n=1 Tax=Ammoniphilus sp. 3BR4 TaxID=3158265 RepID=UPI00346537AB
MIQSVITKNKILLNASVSNKREAIELAGKLLVEDGHVSQEYIGKMFEREEALTTYIGNGVAIPHGTEESKKWIKSSGISILQIPNGVDFGNGNTAYLVIGIAGAGNDHLDILSNIAIACSEEENVKRIVQATSEEEIAEIFERGI